MKFQSITVVSSILVSALIAMPATGDPVQDLEECRSIAVESERLACFDAGYDQLRSAGMTADSMLQSRVIKIQVPSPVSEGEGDTTGAARKERKVFGLRLPSFGRSGSETEETFGQKKNTIERSKDGRIAGISSTALEVSSDAFGKLIITLENGQKWYQTDGGRIRAKAGDTVAIRAGVMGGYFMQVKKGRSVRARRIDDPASADATGSDAQVASVPDLRPAPEKKEGIFARFGKPFSGKGKDTSEEDFGQLESKNDGDGAEEVTSMTQTVAKILADPYDNFIITLENGQVWRQVESGRIRIREGDSVTIEQTLMGGHMLQVDDKGRAIRVRRAD